MTHKKNLIISSSGFVGHNIINNFLSITGYEVFGTYFQASSQKVKFKRLNETSFTSRQDSPVLVERKIVIYLPKEPIAKHDLEISWRNMVSFTYEM